MPAVSGAGAQGPVVALLNNSSVVKGVLHPFGERSTWEKPHRHRRCGCASSSFPVGRIEPEPDAATQEFRFEFSDAEVLAGRCVSASPVPRGTWLQVLLPDGAREHWFVDSRECVLASLDGRPIGSASRTAGHAAAERPDSVESLWALLEAARPRLEKAPELGEALLRGGWIAPGGLQRAPPHPDRTVRGSAGATSSER